MKQEKNNSKLIYTLATLWGFWLISLQFAYYMGSTDGFADALNAMIPHLPTSIPILMLSLVTANQVKKTHIKVEFTKRHFIAMIILCCLFFPIGLFFLFGTRKYKNMKA